MVQGGAGDRGTLIALLEGFSVGVPTLQIVYPHAAVQPRRVRALIERIAAAFAGPEPGGT